MKDGNWIALHKELKFFLPHGRKYTTLEAMFSYTIDIDNKKKGTISGYSKLWGWDRKKVRRFIEELGTGTGHFRDRDGTGKEHQILLKINNLKDRKDTFGTGTGQARDTIGDTTINPNPKPNPKKNIYTDFPELNLEAWKEWLAYKKEIKKPYKTERGERSKIHELINLSKGDKELQAKIIKQSINDEYAGFYQLKNTTKRNTNEPVYKDLTNYDPS